MRRIIERQRNMGQLEKIGGWLIKSMQVTEDQVRAVGYLE